MQKRTVYQITESAVMLALSTLLSLISVYKMPYGGSITLCSMVPLLYLSYRYPVKWGLFVACIYALLQMLLGFYPPPTSTFLSFVAVIALDYIVAFGVLGLAGFFAKAFKGIVGTVFGETIVMALRFLCHFISGIIIWKVYAPEGQSPALYSFLYNGSFMLGEWILSAIALVALHRILKGHHLGLNG